MQANNTATLEAFLKNFSSTRSATKPIAVFDCDGTVIKGDIGESMLYFQLERFLFRVSPASLWIDFPKREELHNLYEGLSKLPPERISSDRRFVSFADMVLSWYFDQLEQGETAKACADIVRLFAGYSSDEVRQVAAATLRRELNADLAQRTLGRHLLPEGIRYIKDSVDLLSQLKASGFDIWSVSGSNQWSVEAVFEPLGIHRDRVIGIDLIDIDDVLSSTVKTPIPVLEGKVNALRERAKGAPLLVVSDSTYDIPLFGIATGLRILINSRNGTSHDFFTRGKVKQDDTWLVIDSPTVEPSPRI
jgi:phosphoserine phosphatase